MAYTGIQLGKDVKTQTEAINTQTRELIETQLASTSAIIATQERVAEGIDNIEYGIEKVEQGIYGLQAAFEWGIAEVVWQIEQNRNVLRDILKVLSEPLDTQAKELRKRAEEAYGNGWIVDALEDFLESEKKNRYDFSIHISIGNIYLFHKDDKTKAVEYYGKAIKYAKPKSPYHASYALLHRGFIHYHEGAIEEAERCATEAVELSPDFAEALYQNAQYNAILRRHDKAIPLLKKALKIDSNYCERSHNDRDFNNIRTHVNMLFGELRDEEAKKVKSEHTHVKEQQQLFNDLKDRAKSGDVRVYADDQIARLNERTGTLIKRNSYRDYLEADQILLSIKAKQKEVFSIFKEKVHSRINECRNIVTEETYKKQEFYRKFRLIYLLIGLNFIPIIVSCILDFLVYQEFLESWLDVIISIIPGINWLLVIIALFMMGTASPLEQIGIILMIFVGILYSVFILSLFTRMEINVEMRGSIKEYKEKIKKLSDVLHNLPI